MHRCIPVFAFPILAVVLDNVPHYGVSTSCGGCLEHCESLQLVPPMSSSLFNPIMHNTVISEGLLLRKTLYRNMYHTKKATLIYEHCADEERDDYRQATEA